MGLCFQNFTTVDFTVESQGPKSPPTALERAILKADKEQSIRKKKLGVDDRQIHKTYLKRVRKPSSVGDLPFSELEKHKRRKKAQRRLKSSPQYNAVVKPAGPPAAQ